MKQTVTVVLLNPNELYDAEILCVTSNRETAEKWLGANGFIKSDMRINGRACWLTDKYNGTITCEDHHFVM